MRKSCGSSPVPSMASMSRPPVALIRRLLADLPTVGDIRWAAEVTSTNAVLAADVDAAPGTVLVADVQTQGRGRRGRSWHAPPGTSLMLSILLRPDLPRDTWSLLPLVAGTALAQACRAATGIARERIALKWPNDLLVDGVKAAGILAETIDDRVILGMGINTDWRGVDRPPRLSATSLAERLDADVDRWVLLDHLLRALDHHYRLARRDPGGIVQRYLPDCATLGQQVTAHTEIPINGTAMGLTPQGHLRIRTPQGRDQLVTAGEVEHLR